MVRKIYRCPHCKGEARVVEHRGEEMGFLDVQVACTECDMRGPEVSVGFRPTDEAKAEAVRLWNSIASNLGSEAQDATSYRDSILTPGKARATDKQVSFANAIARRLGIDPPAEQSKDVYRSFISTHVAEFRRLAPKIESAVSHRQDPEPERDYSELDRDWGHEYCGWDYADEDNTHIGPP